MKQPTKLATKPHQQRGAGAVDDAGKDVAPELVGAEQELQARRFRHVLERVRRRIVRSDDVGEDRHQHHQQHDQAAGDAERLGPNHAAHEVED